MNFPKFKPSKNRKIESTPATVATVATRAELNENKNGNVAGVPTVAAPPSKSAVFEDRSNVADVATVAGGVSETAFFEDLYFEFEERAAIIAEGCDIPQAQATELAAIQFGFGREFYETKIGRRPTN